MNNRVSSFGHTICIKHFYRLCCLMCLVSWARQLDIMMDMSRGIISSFMSSPFTLTVTPSWLNASILDLCWCLHTVATDIQWILTTRSEQTDQILSHTQWRCGRIRPDFKTKSDLHAVWTKAFCWRELRGFESRLTSPGRGEAQCLPDGGNLMMLDSCPQRRHSASAWESYRWSHLRNKARSCRGVDFTLVSETRQDSWIPTVKEPLLYTDRTPMRPCPHTQLTRQLSSPTLQHMIVTLCRRRENDFLDCLYTQKTSTVKVTAE